MTYRREIWKQVQLRLPLLHPSPENNEYCIKSNINDPALTIMARNSIITIARFLSHNAIVRSMTITSEEYRLVYTGKSAD